MRFFPTISSNPTVHILYLTFNRLYYTQITLPVLLESSNTASFQIYIVDNGSTDGTVEYLQSLNHPKIEKVIYNKKNEGLVKPTKKFWAESNAELVGKIDNDILVPENWIDKLIDAHLKIPALGVFGYCHFREEDFNNNKVMKKVENINDVYLRRQPWIGGNYLIKRDTVIQNPYYRQSRKLFHKRILYGFNKYQEKLSDKGYIHGYIANSQKELLLWEHLDDPRNQLYHLDEEYLKIRNMSTQKIIEWYKKDAQNLLEGYIEE